MDTKAEGSHEKKILHERTWMRTVLLAVFLVVVAIGLYYLSEVFGELKWHMRQAIAREFAAAVVTTGLVAFLWETYAKRALMEELKPEFSELIGEVRLAQDVTRAGLSEVATDFQKPIDWPSLFKAQEIDVFFSYAHTWIANNRTSLEQLAQRSEATIRVVVADPGNEKVVSSLAYRFGKTEAEVKNKIIESENELKKIFSEKPCNFSLHHSPIVPIYTFYRFDHKIVLAMYKHQSIRGGALPVFVVEQGGTIHNFMVEEMKEIFEKALQAFPANPPKADVPPQFSAAGTAAASKVARA